MQNIVLIQIGKVFQPFIAEGVAVFEKRLKHYCNYTSITIADVKNAAVLNTEQLKKQESIIILKHIQNTDWLILLDEQGKEFTSIQFSEHLNKLALNSSKRIVFLIGGAFGFDAKVYERANEMMALSKLTFSHQMVRLFFIEQLYRAYTIIKGEKYHHQ